MKCVRERETLQGLYASMSDWSLRRALAASKVGAVKMRPPGRSIFRNSALAFVLPVGQETGPPGQNERQGHSL
jgi:hypothetical protein